MGALYGRGFLWHGRDRWSWEQKKLASPGPFQAVIDNEIATPISWQWLLATENSRLRLCPAGRSAGSDSDICPRLETNRDSKNVKDFPFLYWGQHHGAALLQLWFYIKLFSFCQAFILTIGFVIYLTSPSFSIFCLCMVLLQYVPNYQS